MMSREQMNQISLLNRTPLNQACRAKLPPDWQGESSLHLLGLLRWGLQHLPFPGQWGVSEDEADAQLLALEDGRPVWAQDWLTKNSAGDVILEAEAIEELDRDEAAQLLLDLMLQQKVAR